LALRYYSHHSDERFVWQRATTMLKGLIVCFAVLFAQLSVLSIIDARLYNAQDARQVTSTVVTPQKEEDGDDHEPPLL
jgi:cell division protein FtsI/penicillin-binding protein 2|tara:strand:+ start:26 stop:259 length:234 start_codon:yes stop_codon:yes gene_type:complete